MRLQLLLGLFLVVHLVNSQKPRAKDATPSIPLEDEEEDEDQFNDDDTEDAPFQFTEEAAFHDMHSPPPSTKSKIEKIEESHGQVMTTKEITQHQINTHEPTKAPSIDDTEHHEFHHHHEHHLHDGEISSGSLKSKEIDPKMETKMENKKEEDEEGEDEEEAEVDYEVPEEEQVHRETHLDHHDHLFNHEPSPIPNEETKTTLSPPSPSPEPTPQTLPEPQPKPEPPSTSTGKDTPRIPPTPLPEPAIKFDNIKDEDYGENEAESTKPDAVDNEVIEQLVNKFLNTGSATDKNATTSKFVNGEAQKLVGSSEYWNDKDIKAPGSIKDKLQAEKWLDGYYKEAQKVLYQVTTAGWHYFTSISPNSRKALAEAQEVMSRFVRSTSMQAKQFDVASMPEEMKKQLNYVSFEGMSALSEKDHQAFTTSQDHVNQQISETLTCDKGVKAPCTLKKVDISAIFNSDNDPEHLKYLWTAFIRNVARLKPHYKKILDLSNAAAKLNGFSDGGAMWRSAFDLATKISPPKIDLKQQMLDVYNKILPFYKQLHAYLRRQISGIFKNPEGLTKDQSIPAHLFGSTEGGDWSLHYESTKPTMEEDMVAEEIIEAMQEQNYTSKTMFVKAYRYFKSVGFPQLPKSFWTNSVFQRVWSKDMLCEPAAAFDMRDGEDYRVKACAQIGEPDFKLAHSLLSQVYYQYLYRKQPLAFRESASPSINEAIANVFLHLASNPNYLYSQGLVNADQLQVKESTIINRLYREALNNVAKIPFALTADTWRYDILEGNLTDPMWNERWWKLRESFEGVRQPESKSNPSHVDAFMHTQITQIHSPAARNLIGYVAQFQILKSLCPPETELAEGCILSEDTTMKLREMMSMGSSIDWLKALEMLTGKAELNADPLLEYYKPLMMWLENANEINQVYLGWDGEGIKFSKDEIPEMQSNGKVSSGILSQDRVAFPGGDCTNGEECLLDSRCDGKTCICNDGLFTLRFDNTVSCVASNPMESGFVGGDGEFIGVNLVPSETTTTAKPKANITVTPMHRPTTRTSSANDFLLWLIFTSVIARFLI